ASFSQKVTIGTIVSDYWDAQKPHAQPEWWKQCQPFNRPSLLRLSPGFQYLSLYYGASFNPPHEIHGKLLAMVWEVTIAIAPWLDIVPAAALVGCSGIEDLRRKTREQNSRHEARIIAPLPSQKRQRLWSEGILNQKLEYAMVTGCNDWTEFWDLNGYMMSRFDRQNFHVRHARIVKIDGTKPGHNSVFTHSKEPQVFQPLYKGTCPGSGEVSNPGSRPVIAMKITMVTNFGGQGTWTSPDTQEPWPLKGYTQWTKVKSEIQNTSVRGCWTCHMESDDHQVIYIDTAAISENLTQSVDAWDVINDKGLVHEDKVERLQNFFAPELLLDMAQEAQSVAC
ncbi:hypothetical protein JX265_014018, partial [Neoarthrinium moseri]